MTTQFDYGWADLDAANRNHYAKRAANRNERAAAEERVWALQLEIVSWVEDNASAFEYLETLHYQNIDTVLVAAALTCRTGDMEGAASMISGMTLDYSDSPIRKHWNAKLHALALEITGAPVEDSELYDQNVLRHGG
jgi:hypothetical protein